MPDGSYSISNIQYYFEYILKKHGEKTVNPSIKIYINKITFEIETGTFEILTPETMKLFGSTKSKITKNKNDGNVPHLEITGVVLIHCDAVNIVIKKNSTAFYMFIPNTSLGQLLNISPENFISLKTFDSEFSHIDLWFTDQNSKLLEKEDKIKYKNDVLFSSNKR